MNRLQRNLISQSHRLHQSCCLIGVCLVLGILEQPFDDDTGIDHDGHGLPDVRVARICSFEAVGRCLRRWVSE
jgi:hypothetical protein